MLKKYSLNNRASSFAEQAILIIVVATALLAMHVYIRRGIQGKMRDTADNIADQYAPNKTVSTIVSGLKSTVVTKIELVDAIIIDDDGQEKQVKVTIINTDIDKPEVNLETSDEKTPDLEDNLFE